MEQKIFIKIRGFISKNKKVLLVGAGLVVFLLILLFSVRGILLRNILAKITANQLKANQLILSVDNARFTGMATLKFDLITVKPIDKDTLLQLRDFSVRVNLFPLLLGKISLSELTLDSGFLQLTIKEGVKNFDFLFKNNSVDTSLITTNKSTIHIAQLANDLLNKTFQIIPDDLGIKYFNFSLVDEDKLVSIAINNTQLKNEKLNATFDVNNGMEKWYATGHINSSNKKLDLKLFGENKPVELAYLKDKFDLTFRFDTISTQMQNATYGSNKLTITGNWNVNNLVINHPKISLQEIIIPDARIDASMIFGNNYIAIDSNSVAIIKDLKITPYIKYTHGDFKEYELKLNIPKMPAQLFFDSFPRGLFVTLEGIKVQGNLAFNLDFKLNSKEPDSVLFNSTLQKDGFKIVQFGNENLRKINGVFTYVPFEYGRPMRSIIVGQDNPNYTPYEYISEYLKQSVLNAEDGSFFWHKGFNEESFRKSIATNYKSKNFKRGGSTISMQLVKNIFLNRNKTVLRKVEEALIVWLIENNNISNKQRMFEVYLNIIEWAPNIYGIGEAAKFYFDKNPSQLTLGESIFLTSIVPKPKAFKYSFNSDGTLRDYLTGYFNLINGILIRKGIVSEEETFNAFNSVKLKGPALKFVMLSDDLDNKELLFDDENQQEILREINGITEDIINRKTPIMTEENKPESPKEERLERREQRRLEREKRRSGN